MLLALVIACFTFSGFAALLYQTAWLRLFAISFGASEVAIAVVLAGYMAGLAIGAAVAARYIHAVRRPVLVYGMLEAAIALSALAMPWLVGLSGDLYGQVAGGQAIPPDAGAIGQLLYYSIASTLILLIPTSFMGATLPLLARYAVTSNRSLGPRVSMLYAMNTLGAVAGTLAAGFLLLPELGLGKTVLVGAAVNFVVFVIAVFAARVASLPAVSTGPSRACAASRAEFILPLVLLSGAVSFTYEILWTRMLSHVLGSSIYAFAIMLSAFLTGIAAGAAVAAPLAKDSRRAAFLFGGNLFGVAVFSALVFEAMQLVAAASAGSAWFAFAVMVPSTVFIGASYPLAVRAHASSVADVGRSAGRVYAWNTIGAVAGALVGGFVIIPALGFEGTARLAVIANIAIGMIALLCVSATTNWQPVSRRSLSLTALAMLVVVVLFQPQRPASIVNRTLFGGSGETQVREVFFGVGRSSTVWLTENEGRFDLTINGLPEAQIEFLGAPPLLLSQRWLGIWPSLFRPQTESMLVIGLGGGVALEAVPQNVTTVHVAELEAEVLAANRRVAARRTTNPLARDGLHIAINDARNALRLTSRRYDAIISQPSHPWTAGASHLFTREFVALARSRLAQNGIFVQWMNAEFLNEDLLRQLAATLLAEFDYVQVYQPSSLALHFVASNQPIVIPDSIPAGAYSANGISSPLDIVSTILLDEKTIRQFARGQAPVTDDDNRMAMKSNVLARGLGAQSLAELLQDHDALLNPNSLVRRHLTGRQLVFVMSRLLFDEQHSRADKFAASVPDEPLQRILRAMLLQFRGEDSRAAQLLRLSGVGDETFDEARLLSIETRPPIASHCDAAAIPEIRRGSLDAVLEGWCLHGIEDWDALAQLETRLGDVRPERLWYAHAIWLRASWRLHVTDHDSKLAHEALRLIDEAVARAPTPVLLALRARAAGKLRLPAHEIESVAHFVRAIDDRLRILDFSGSYMREPERHWAGNELRNFVARMDDLGKTDDTGRAETVRSMLTDLNNYLETY